MCLDISKKFKKDKRDFLKKNPPNKDGYIKGWKVFERRIEGGFGVYSGKLYAPYLKNDIFVGINKSNRMSKIITENEKNYLEIELGCHFFLTEKDARTCIKMKGAYNRWRKFVQRVIYYKPNDLVAVGQFVRNNCTNSGVVMKYFLPRA